MRDATIDSRVDYYFVNSPIIKRRLWKYYKRESEVLYPPVELEKYRNEGDEGYFLHLGRLDEEKGVPAVVKTFERLNEQLVMAGGMGDIKDSVRRHINEASNIDYRGFVPEEEKLDLLANCTAVVFNGQNEDFGIVPIEANASGKPVLARNDGFPEVFIANGKNGYVHDGTSYGVKHAVGRLLNSELNINEKRLTDFSVGYFEDKISSNLAKKYQCMVNNQEAFE